MMLRTPEYRARLVRIITGVWLSFISTLAIVDHVALSRLSEDVKSSNGRTESMALIDDLAVLDQRVNAIERQPAALSESSFTQERQKLDDRLSRIEQVNKNTASTDDLAVLRDRVNAIEARLASAKQSAAPNLSRRPKATDAKPKLIEPPFTLIGIELRSGEPFVSLAPVGTHSLTQVRLLRVGDSEGHWRLESLDGKTAEFRIAGRSQRLVIP